MYSLCLLNESSNIRKKGPVHSYVHSNPFVNAYKLVSLPLSKLHSSVKRRRGGGRGREGVKRVGKGKKSSGKRKNITKIEQNIIIQRTKEKEKKNRPAKLGMHAKT